MREESTGQTNTVSSNGGGRLGCGAMAAIVLGLLAAVGVVGAIVDAQTPATVTMPNFAGKSCKDAQAQVDRLFKEERAGVRQDDTMAGSSPSICTGSVVIRTDPAAGSVIDLKASDRIPVRWWAIETDAYRWYKKHRKMPNLIGKALDSGAGLTGHNDPTSGFVSEVIDGSLVQIGTGATGWYEHAEHKIVRTDPAPGEKLKIGQPMTIYTQIQRGKWIPYSGGSGGSPGGGGVNFYACTRLSVFRFCAT